MLFTVFFSSCPILSHKKNVRRISRLVFVTVITCVVLELTWYILRTHVPPCVFFFIIYCTLFVIKLTRIEQKSVIIDIHRR